MTRYTDVDIQRIVSRRKHWRKKRQHFNAIGTAAVKNDYELVGVAGEVAFAEAFDLKIDEHEHQQGDGGIDFVTSVGTVDVKTTRFGRNALRLKKGKKMADFIFMAQYDETTQKARLVGWVTRAEVEQSPVEDATADRRFKQNWVVSRRRLRRVEEFKEMVEKVKGKEEVAA